MIKEAEDIIMNKSYFELTAEELAEVSIYAKNEEEFEEMKWFLISTQEAMAGDKIDASDGLKKRVMGYMDSPGRNKIWLNSVVLFLFPRDTQFYKKPAFHVALAACMVIGFLFIYDQTKIENESLALNDLTEERTTSDITTEDVEGEKAPETEIVLTEESEDENITNTRFVDQETDLVLKDEVLKEEVALKEAETEALTMSGNGNGEDSWLETETDFSLANEPKPAAAEEKEEITVVFADSDNFNRLDDNNNANVATGSTFTYTSNDANDGASNTSVSLQSKNEKGEQKKANSDGRDGKRKEKRDVANESLDAPVSVAETSEVSPANPEDKERDVLDFSKSSAGGTISLMDEEVDTATVTREILSNQLNLNQTTDLKQLFFIVK